MILCNHLSARPTKTAFHYSERDMMLEVNQTVSVSDNSTVTRWQVDIVTFSVVIHKHHSALGIFFFPDAKTEKVVIRMQAGKLGCCNTCGGGETCGATATTSH